MQVSARKRNLIVASILAVSAGAWIIAAAGAEDDIGARKNHLVAEAKGAVAAISVDEFAALMDTDGDYTLIDVRTEAEFEQGHIRGAVWVPRGKLEFIAASGTLGDLDDDLILYCRIDGRSCLAAHTLQQLGFSSARYLEGGFLKWVTAGQSIYNMHGEIIVKNFEKLEDE